VTVAIHRASRYQGTIDETRPLLAGRCQHESVRSLINMLINRPATELHAPLHHCRAISNSFRPLQRRRMQLAGRCGACREIRTPPADVIALAVAAAAAAAARHDSLSIAHCASAASDKFIYAASRTSCRFPFY